jgi:hypothetical protein
VKGTASLTIGVGSAIEGGWITRLTREDFMAVFTHSDLDEGALFVIGLEIGLV